MCDELLHVADVSSRALLQLPGRISLARSMEVIWQVRTGSTVEEDQVEDTRGLQWTDYWAPWNAKLEQAYRFILGSANPGTHSVVELFHSERDEDFVLYEVDVRACTQTNVQSNTVREVRRVQVTHRVATS